MFLGLTPFSEVYTGGGRFMLIGPGGLDLKELRSNAESILLDTLGGQIGLSLSSADFGPADLTGDHGGIGQVLFEIGRSLNREKRRRFHSSAPANYARVFGAFKANQECEICRAPLKANENPESCELCQRFIDLGTKLRRAKYLIDHVPAEGDPFSRIGRTIEPVRELTDANIRRRPSAHGRICQINGFDAIKLGEAVRSAPSGEMPVTGSKLMAVRTPEDPDDQTVVPFEKLAQRSRGDKNHIALIRADVDDLGSLFHELGFQIHHDNGEAFLGRFLCDSASHVSCTDDPDFMHPQILRIHNLVA